MEINQAAAKFQDASIAPIHSAESDASPIVIYTSEDNIVSLEVKMSGETVWLNRAQISLLFGRDIKTIGKHINNALKEELEGQENDSSDKIEFKYIYSLEEVEI